MRFGLCPDLQLVRDFQLMKGVALMARLIPYTWRLDWTHPVVGAELLVPMAGVIAGIAVDSFAMVARTNVSFS
jgi:hypothetical protein